MNLPANKWPRGAEWRRWDLHVHTPASQLGNPFVGVSWADYVSALDDAAVRHRIAVIGVTDYMTVDGYEILLSHQRDLTASRLNSVILLPNIEFRCSPQTKEGQALNIHLIINVADADHVEKIKKSLRNLKVSYKNQTYGCTRDDLIEFAKAQNSSLTDDLAAYKFGIEQFKPSYTDIFDWLDSEGWLKVNSVVGIANGKDGISGLPLDSFAAIRDELLCRAHFVFSGNPADRQHYLGLKSGFPAAEIKRQYNSLKPCFHGSDAHHIQKFFEPDQRRYCWIKADPTFLGLQQAIKEPNARSFIGEKPPKLVEVEGNKTYFIDRIEVNKIAASTLGEAWLDSCSIPLNTDLVAVIGNKGSGKSALADVIALLGKNRPDDYFSFLKRNRFRGKSGDPARQFTAEITWLSGASHNTNLNLDPSEGGAKLVRYLPQGYFETLCAEHASGKTNAFQTELQSVIFEHANDEIRLGALDFDQLLERQEGAFRDQLIEYRKELTRVNRDIENLEGQSQPQVKRSLQELVDLKTKQIDEHALSKPAPIAKPDQQLSEIQQGIANQIDTVLVSLNEIAAQVVQITAATALIAAKRKAVQSIRERVRLLERQYTQFQTETVEDFQILGMNEVELISLNIKLEPLDTASSTWVIEEINLVESRRTIDKTSRELLLQQSELQTQLNGPQLEYQKNLHLVQQWDAKLQELIGTADAPETLSGLNARIAQLGDLPAQLTSKRERRINLTGEIFDALNSQRESREKLFKPVQDLIQDNQLIRDEHRLQFQATLGGSSDALASALFSLMKQNSGEFSGEDESYSTINRLFEQIDLSTRDGALTFVALLNEKIHAAASKNNPEIVGISSVLRKDRLASAVYDLLYGLSYLEPRYSLLFQDTEIEQLSPGQRGALLLIFYLLVDKGRNPIILDQPEENLDNETVYNLLVPVLMEAKKQRQIIMVTHNPNLAVVCDAEQVIYSLFDRKNGFKITYLAGSIESPALNSHVVNVLEGTKPAFENRRIKYH